MGRPGGQTKPGLRYPSGKLKLPRIRREFDSVYVMVSETALLKIGISNSPARRAAELTSSEGIRMAVAWIAEVSTREDARKLETAVHRRLQGFREHVAGEWYRMSREEAIRAVKEEADTIGVAIKPLEENHRERGLWHTKNMREDSFALYEFGGLTVDRL